MDVLLSLSEPSAAAPDTPPHAAKFVPASLAPKRAHRATHGRGPGSSFERMKTLRLYKQLKKDIQANEPSDLQRELDLSFHTIGKMRCSFASMEALLGEDRRRAVEMLRTHVAVMYFSQRVVLMHLLARGLEEQYRTGQMPPPFDGEQLSRMLLEQPVSVIEMPQLPKFSAGLATRSHVIEVLEHDETRTPSRLITKEYGDRALDIKGSWSAFVLSTWLRHGGPLPHPGPGIVSLLR